MSKFLKTTILSVLAIISAYGFAGVRSAEAATCVNLASNLTVGQKGASVSALQTFLIETGYLKATADGSYGPKTKAAVIAFQASFGSVSNPEGLVGPTTRAKIREVSCGAGSSASTVGTQTGTQTGSGLLSTACPAGALFNLTTGLPCSQTNVTASSVLGCQAGMTFSPLTGASCVGDSATPFQSVVPGCTATTVYSPLNGQACNSGVGQITSGSPVVSYVIAGNGLRNILYGNSPVTIHGSNFGTFNDVYLESSSGATYKLSSNRISSGSLSLTLAANTVPAGIYNLYVVTQGLRSQSIAVEYSTANAGNGTYPDITISDVTCTPTSPTAGVYVDCSVTVYNGSSITINESFDVISEGVVRTIYGLTAWASKTVVFDDLLNFGSAGTQYVDFWADSTDVIYESNEGNNRLTKTLAATGGSGSYDLTRNFTTPSCPYTFSSDLILGSTGNEVIALQNHLKDLGYYSGNSHGYYDQATKSAVLAYQASKSISSADGGVGSVTRTALNQSCGTSGTGSFNVSLSASAPATVYQKSSFDVAWTGTGIAPTTVINVQIVKADGTVTTLKTSARFSAGKVTIAVPATFAAGQYRAIVSSTILGAIVQAETGAFTVPVAGVEFSKASEASISTASDSAGKTASLVAQFQVSMHAKGVDVPLLAANDITLAFIGPSGQVISADRITVVTTPSRTTLSGQTAVVVIQAEVAGSKLPGSGSYKAELRAIRWATVPTTLDTNVFKTPSVNVTR